MKELIGEWVGQHVWVTVRGVLIGVWMKGDLLKVDESGVLLEQPKGETFIPATSILHIVKR